MQHDGNYWFPAKRYGWGWGPPNCWQGWAIVVGFVALLAVGAATIQRHSHVGFVAYVVVLSVLLTGVCWWKGEPPRWRWGGD
ncbi:hypothetical protein [Bradyrhizobium septentrionale]|uniref:Uncharacterized protein n=1 Tax=Bradyrhizobium septentrionale TaxID=1404411 RepID=A0A974A083_9BRAD|nr:hypothetical protein [Bradyrhizobium septentrionale]UGY12139.1 hypothetical protein HAP48_0025680 [Bradyrhizobium septentrionale]UGY29326.1 hypothetical protein HU675_0022890 [Bradyrhizobium septentrionale]